MNEQHEFYENARKRVRQKKRLYFHFVLFLVGSVFLFVLDKILLVEEFFIQNWFVWAVILWFFLWVLHFINVFITHKFMGNEWERKQTEKLILKQELKTAKMEKEMAREAQLKAESEQYATELKKKENPQNNKKA